MVMNCRAGENMGTEGQAEADERRADWIRLSADGEDNRKGHESGREDHQDDSQPHEPVSRPIGGLAGGGCLPSQVSYRVLEPALHLHLVTRSREPRCPGDQFLVAEVPALACAVKVLRVHTPPPLLIPALA